MQTPNNGATMKYSHKRAFSDDHHLWWSPIYYRPPYDLVIELRPTCFLVFIVEVNVEVNINL